MIKDSQNEYEDVQTSPDMQEAYQVTCQNLPNDASEHYWSWVNAPQSIPKQYRECMLCKRLDATEWLEEAETKARIDELERIKRNIGAYPDDILNYNNELLGKWSERKLAHSRIDQRLATLQHPNKEKV